MFRETEKEASNKVYILFKAVISRHEKELLNKLWTVRWKQHVLSRWADQKETLNMSQSSSWSNTLRINNAAHSDFDNKIAKKLSLEAQSHS